MSEIRDGESPVAEVIRSVQPVYRYKAFLSYSHAADAELASRLQAALHRFAKPWYRLRAIRVFRDQTNLAANPGLWSEIQRALGRSRNSSCISPRPPRPGRGTWVWS